VLVVSAGAALRSAMRFAPQVVLEPEEALPDPSGFLTALATDSHPPGDQPDTKRAAEPDGVETRPGPSTWPIPEARRAAETGRDGTAGPDAPGEAGERRSARSGRRQPNRYAGSYSRRRWWSAAAAAVLVLAGIGAGVLVTRDRTGPPSQQIDLQAVAPWTATATATLQGSRIDVHPHNLAPPKPGHYYELWLTRTKPTPGADGSITPTAKVVSVGTLNPTGAILTVPPSLASAYDTMVVTDEIDNGVTTPSGIGVMSGLYHS